MSTSYKKLWKLLIDRDLKKKDLQELAGISNYTVSKRRGIDIREAVNQVMQTDSPFQGSSEQNMWVLKFT